MESSISPRLVTQLRWSDQIAWFSSLDFSFFDKNACSKLKLSIWFNDRRFLDNYNHCEEQLSISPAMGVSHTLHCVSSRLCFLSLADNQTLWCGLEPLCPPCPPCRYSDTVMWSVPQSVVWTTLSTEMKIKGHTCCRQGDKKSIHRKVTVKFISIEPTVILTLEPAH